MKKILIDTNSLISFITDRNEEQQKIISEFINNAAEHNINIILLDIVISEFVYVLEAVYNFKNKMISQMLKDIQKTTGFIIQPYFDFDRVIDIWPDRVNDYWDSILASYAFAKKLPVLTFDKKLQNQLKKMKVQVIPAL